MENDESIIATPPGHISETGPSEPLPVLYSLRAIDVFSTIMFPLWGAVMMAMNLRRINRSDGILVVLGFGVAYLILVGYLVDLFPKSPPVHLWNAVGTCVLHYGFWPRYFGKDPKFQKRKIWKPTVAAVLVSAILIWALLV